MRGGAAYTAELDGKFYVITDESTMAEFLSEEDAQDLADYLQPRGRVFDSAQERDCYLIKRYGPSKEMHWHVVSEMTAVPVPDLTRLSDSATNTLTRRRVAELHRMAQEGDFVGIAKFSTSRTRNNYIIVDDYRAALLNSAARAQGLNSQNLRQLENMGFRIIGVWFLEKDGLSFRLSNQHFESANILYAFIHQGELVYLGKTGLPLEKRLWDFTYKSKQGELIREALSDWKTLEIYALRDNDLLYFGGFW